MNKRIKQASLGSLFTLMWLLFFTATAAKGPSTLHPKTAIEKNTPSPKAPLPFSELKENLEEESEDAAPDREAEKIYHLFSLLVPEYTLTHRFRVNHLPDTSPTVGLFILFCSLRIPLPHSIG